MKILNINFTLLVGIGVIALSGYVIAKGDFTSVRSCWQLLSCVFAITAILANTYFVPEMYPEVQAQFRRWLTGITGVSVISGILSILL